MQPGNGEWTYTTLREGGQVLGHGHGGDGEHGEGLHLGGEEEEENSGVESCQDRGARVSLDRELLASRSCVRDEDVWRMGR